MREILPIAMLWGYIGVVRTIFMMKMAISGPLFRIRLQSFLQSRGLQKSMSSEAHMAATEFGGPK